MIITEAKLKQIILEEVKSRLDELQFDKEMSMLLLELDEKADSDKFMKKWKESQTFRSKVKDFIKTSLENYDNLGNAARKTLLAVIAIGGAFTVDFASEYASDSASREISKELRKKQTEMRDKYFGTVEDMKNFRDAATSEGAAPIKPNDDAGIRKVKAKFMKYGFEDAPIIADAAIEITTGDNAFLYTPADSIPDNEYLPFVGMTKADWEITVRQWLSSPKGLKRLERYVGTSGSTISLFWSYGPAGEEYYPAFDDAPDGQQGMWLPPEWSVAYDVIQKNKARAGRQPTPEDDLDLSIPLGTTWKENLKECLHSILNLL
jgi:hypothetical protein